VRCSRSRCPDRGCSASIAEAAERGSVDASAQLLLVDNGANLGFAAGNNVGLRLALARRT
jgi:GT2 family glycosyltransferase